MIYQVSIDGELKKKYDERKARAIVSYSVDAWINSMSDDRVIKYPHVNGYNYTCQVFILPFAHVYLCI